MRMLQKYGKTPNEVDEMPERFLRFLDAYEEYTMEKELMTSG